MVRLTIQVPVFSLFIELEGGTPLQVGLIISKFGQNHCETGATNEIAEFQTIVDFVPTDQ